MAKVCSLTNKGLVKALTPGRCTVKVSTYNKKYSATCIIIVADNTYNPNPSDWSSDENKILLHKAGGNTLIHTLSISGNASENYSFEVDSSDKWVITVDKSWVSKNETYSNWQGNNSVKNFSIYFGVSENNENSSRTATFTGTNLATNDTARFVITQDIKIQEGTLKLFIYNENKTIDYTNDTMSIGNNMFSETITVIPKEYSNGNWEARDYAWGAELETQTYIEGVTPSLNGTFNQFTGEKTLTFSFSSTRASDTTVKLRVESNTSYPNKAISNLMFSIYKTITTPDKEGTFVTEVKWIKSNGTTVTTTPDRDPIVIDIPWNCNETFHFEVTIKNYDRYSGWAVYSNSNSGWVNGDIGQLVYNRYTENVSETRGSVDITPNTLYGYKVTWDCCFQGNFSDDAGCHVIFNQASGEVVTEFKYESEGFYDWQGDQTFQENDQGEMVYSSKVIVFKAAINCDDDTWLPFDPQEITTEYTWIDIRYDYFNIFSWNVNANYPESTIEEFKNYRTINGENPLWYGHQIYYCISIFPDINNSISPRIGYVDFPGGMRFKVTQLGKPDGGEEPQYYLNVSPTSFNNLNGEDTTTIYSFNIISNIEWQISWPNIVDNPFGEDSIIIAGQNNSLATFSLKKNTTGSTRTADISVIPDVNSDFFELYSNIEPVTINLSQNPERILTVNGAIINIPQISENTLYSFDITSNTNWQIIWTDSWILDENGGTNLVTQGSGNSTINFKITNNDGNTRESTVTIKTPDNYIVRTLTLRQQGITVIPQYTIILLIDSSLSNLGPDYTINSIPSNYNCTVYFTCNLLKKTSDINQNSSDWYSSSPVNYLYINRNNSLQTEISHYSIGNSSTVTGNFTEFLSTINNGIVAKATIPEYNIEITSNVVKTGRQYNTILMGVIHSSDIFIYENQNIGGQLENIVLGGSIEYNNPNADINAEITIDYATDISNFTANVTITDNNPGWLFFMTTERLDISASKGNNNNTIIFEPIPMSLSAGNSAERVYFYITGGSVNNEALLDMQGYQNSYADDYTIYVSKF